MNFPKLRQKKFISYPLTRNTFIPKRFFSRLSKSRLFMFALWKLVPSSLDRSSAELGSKYLVVSK